MKDNTTAVLVLDLDGTLVNTADDLIATLNDVVGRRGIGPFPTAALKKLIGLGARVTLERAFKMAGRSLDDEELTLLTDEFIDHYAGRIAELTTPYPGALRAMDRFRDAGWRLAVCTNKTEFLAKKLLHELDIADYFSAISGQDTFAYRKPDPRHLTQTIGLVNGDPARAVMVGDSSADIEAAKEAGVPVVAVTFGYSPTPVTALGPDRVIDHFDDLWDSVATLPGLPGSAFFTNA